MASESDLFFQILEVMKAELKHKDGFYKMVFYWISR